MFKLFRSLPIGQLEIGVPMVDEKNQVSEEQLSEDDLDKIMKEIVAEESATDVGMVEEPVVVAAAPQPAPISKPANVTPIRTNTVKNVATGSPDQALKLEFTGPINLKLSFTSGSRTIELVCSDETLVCRMADGTEFKIPTGGISSVRKSA
jgi:hypothetical protein